MSVGVQPGGGGIFNSYRVKYSPETHQLLKLLMDEVKMTTMQRRQLKETVKKGESLPVVKKGGKPSCVDENLFDLKRNYYFLRRSKDQIIHSGAYERDRYRNLQPAVDVEKEKERLGKIMAFGKEKKCKSNEKSSETPEPSKTFDPDDRIDELITEIEERLQFLQEMEELGRAERYESVIKQEIAAKMREMRKLDKNSSGKYEKVLKIPTNEAKNDIIDALKWEN